jgi:hypothetical protein
MLVFEGSLEEIKELQKELLRSGTSALAVEVPDLAGRDGSISGLTPGRKFVSAEVALRFFARRPLSKEQRAVITAVYNSQSDGVLASALQREIDYTPSKFAGLMGAFGRRLVHTNGYVDYTWLFDNQWESEHACNRYRFPPSVREAIEQAGLV